MAQEHMRGYVLHWDLLRVLLLINSKHIFLALSEYPLAFPSSKTSVSWVEGVPGDTLIHNSWEGTGMDFWTAALACGSGILAFLSSQRCSALPEEDYSPER